MPKSAYPADSDLLALLTSAGLTVPPSLDLQDKCGAAIAEWETRTGWLPYLAAPGVPGQPLVSTRFFDPPGGSGPGLRTGSSGGRSVFLQAGLLSLTSLAVGVVPDAQGNYAPGSSGTVLTPNLNFYLRPQNAAARSLPVTEIEFQTPPRGVPQSIAVTGVWGRVLLLEDNVWQAVLQQAALDCLPELGISLTGGLVKIQDVQYLTGSGGSPLLNAAAQWGPKFNQLVKLKKRIVV